MNAAGNWVDSPNWTTGAPGIAGGTNSTDIATFDFTLTAGRAVTVDADRNIGGITFGNTSAFGYTLSGGSLRLSNGGVVQTAAANGNHTDTINSAIQIQGDSGSATFTAGATSATSLLSIGAVTGVSTASNVTMLNLNGANTGGSAVTGIIGNGSAGGTLAVVKSGAGIWTLSGVNTYSGGTTVQAGTLSLNNNSALGFGSVLLGNTSGSADATLRSSGGNFTYTNAITVQAGSSGTAKLLANANNQATFTGNILLNKDLILETNNANNGNVLTLSGTISGGGGLIVQNTVSDIRGTTLSGANTFSGGVTLNRGVLRVNNGGSGGTSSAIGTGTLTINNVGGSSALTNTSGAAVTLSTNNAQVWNGNFDFSASGVNSLNLGTGNVSLGTALGASRTVSVNSSGNVANTGVLTVGGAIANGTTANALVKSGAGTLQLTGSSTYTGGTTVSAGTLLVNNPAGGSATGTGAVGVAAGARLGGSGFLAGEVTVSGSLTPGNGLGVLTMGGLNLESSATTTFEINGMTRGTDFDGINLTSGGALDLDGNFVFTFGNGSAFANSTVFDLIDFDTTSTGNISSLVSTGFYAGAWNKSGDIWSLISGGQTLSFSEITGDLSVVPEPSAAILATIAGCVILFRRRWS